jgi:hypothetical protein
MEIASQKIHKLVDDIFPICIFDELSFKTRDYLSKSISVFDHWLITPEDYSFAFSEEEHDVRLSKLTNFYRDLYMLGYDIYSYGLSNDNQRSILVFDSFDEYLCHVSSSVDESEPLTIVIPDMKLIITGGSDYTHPVFYKKDSNLQELQYVVDNNNLFLLTPDKLKTS